MSAYVVVDTKIDNPDAYEEYKALARPIAEKYGGEYLARGGELRVLEADLWTPERIVIIRFPDIASVEAFHASDEYQPAKLLRRANAACTLLVVEGI